MIFDAHFHYAPCAALSLPQVDCRDYAALSCAHSQKEFEAQKSAPGNILKAFGLHPQAAADFSPGDADFLEGLLQKNLISAVGEAGFDYFSAEFKAYADAQEEMWRIQLDFSAFFDVPLVVHCRKANHRLFEYASALRKCPAVLFHSFMGTCAEAGSLLSRGIHGFFSFGKQIMNNNKKAVDCVRNLPVECLLLETDAPFQFLRGEAVTYPCEILDIYRAAHALRARESFDDFCLALERNARSFLGIPIPAASGNDILS